jgi:hypothetical protein|uniref:Uncharacterized protein n=1 Tax=viral metagenome TaxID=1070528 RepID=A0A6C0BRW2_9ZZZZ
MQDSEEYLYEVIKCIYECKRFQDENTKEMHYVSKYPNLSNIYPMIFKKACEKDFDYEKFVWMMSIKKDVNENNVTQHNASIKVGERLVDEYIKPNLT